MLLKAVTGKEYDLIFRRALEALRGKKGLSSLVDLHDCAHEITEAYFSSPKTLLEEHISTFLEKISCSSAQDSVQLNKASISQMPCDHISKVETTLDLGRLYLETTHFLSQTDKLLFSKVWLGETLSEEESAGIEALGTKVRKYLYAQTSTERIYFRGQSLSGKKAQDFIWQNFFKEKFRRTPKVDPPRGGKLSKPVCH